MKRVDVYVLTWVLTLDLVKSAGHAGKLAHLYTQVTGHMLSLSHTSTLSKTDKFRRIFGKSGLKMCKTAKLD